MTRRAGSIPQIVGHFHERSRLRAYSDGRVMHHGYGTPFELEQQTTLVYFVAASCRCQAPALIGKWEMQAGRNEPKAERKINFPGAFKHVG